ncbi:alpha-1B adrenergic receptor-like [Actinia tenebrosa]|uniref:Alpha-1B adrenergic receptor-like n=1 Tax=Actinia tenebrosa TaxID=6105 RepID=A0A6P8IT61_ACTTE|nr:alpha-1B adrenergic receptor-like [Actinia tenebrosa]
MPNFSRCFFMTLDQDNLPPSKTFHIDMIVIIISSVFSVIATTSNAIVIAIICSTPSLRTPSYAVLCCLALSDLLVGLIVQPLVIIVKVGAIFGSFSCRFWTLKEAISWTLSGVSFLAVVLVSVERFLALYLHLKYVQLVTIRRACLTYISFYPLSIFAVSLWLAGVDEKKMGILVAVMTTVSLSVIMVIQYKIYRLVRRHQRQIQQQVDAVSQASNAQKTQRLDINKYKKSTSTIMFVVLLSVLLYMPCICTKAVLSIKGFTEDVNHAYDITWCFLYINSSINPCIYCLRMKEIKQVFLRHVRKYLPCLICS